MKIFVIYADLESMLAEVDIIYRKTHFYQKHKFCATIAVICYTNIAKIDGRFCLYTEKNRA